jgi:hypothetical protein
MLWHPSVSDDASNLTVLREWEQLEHFAFGDDKKAELADLA